MLPRPMQEIAADDEQGVGRSEVRPNLLYEQGAEHGNPDPDSTLQPGILVRRCEPEFPNHFVGSATKFERLLIGMLFPFATLMNSSRTVS